MLLGLVIIMKQKIMNKKYETRLVNKLYEIRDTLNADCYITLLIKKDNLSINFVQFISSDEEGDPKLIKVNAKDLSLKKYSKSKFDYIG